MKPVCLFVIGCMIFNGMSFAQQKAGIAKQYYYHNQQISVINMAKCHTSFLLQGQDRMFEIAVGNVGQSENYYLSDGKSIYAYFGSQFLTSIGYQAYGRNMLSSKDRASHFRYNGEYQDLITGLIDLRARSYDPTNQRFTTLDSIILWNKYNFANANANANANPISHIDPSGHSSETTHFFNQVGHFFKQYWPTLLAASAGAFFIGSALRGHVSVVSNEIVINDQTDAKIYASRVQSDRWEMIRSIENQNVSSGLRNGFDEGSHSQGYYDNRHTYAYLKSGGVFNVDRLLKLTSGAAAIGLGVTLVQTHNHIPGESPLGVVQMMLMAVGPILFGVSALRQASARNIGWASEASILDGFRTNLVENLGVEEGQVSAVPDQVNGPVTFTIGDNYQSYGSI